MNQALGVWAYAQRREHAQIDIGESDLWAAHTRCRHGQAAANSERDRPDLHAPVDWFFHHHRKSFGGGEQR